MKEHFKSTFFLLLFKVNVSSVKLLAVIKYFLSPLAGRLPDMGIVSGIKSLPLARTPPPPSHEIYIDRCITP